MLYNANINAYEEMSIAYHLGFETQQEAEAWCRGFIEAVHYEGDTVPEAYWWNVIDENMEPVSSWSEEEGYWCNSRGAGTPSY